MSKTIIPEAVRKIAANMGLNAAKLLSKDMAEYGDVYELYIETGPGDLSVPTGMPVVVSYRSGKCVILDADLAFELLATLGE